jgi:hypothetical protein
MPFTYASSRSWTKGPWNDSGYNESRRSRELFTAAVSVVLTGIKPCLPSRFLRNQ